jgi:hypothetical protein
MSQTSCERCGFPIPMRWLHAGGALFPPYSIHQRASRIVALRTRAQTPIALS